MVDYKEKHCPVGPKRTASWSKEALGWLNEVPFQAHPPSQDEGTWLGAGLHVLILRHSIPNQPSKVPAFQSHRKQAQGGWVTSPGDTD